MFVVLAACSASTPAGPGGGGDTVGDGGGTGNADGGGADGGGADGGGADGGASGAWSVQRRVSVAPEIGNAVAPANILVDGSHAWFSSSHSPVLGRADLASGEVDRVVILDEPPGEVSLALTDDGAWLYFAAHDGSPAQRVDLATDEITSIDLGLDTVLALAWDPAQQVLFATGARGDGGALVRLHADGTVDSLDFDDAPTALWLDTERDELALGLRADPVGGALVAVDAATLSQRSIVEFGQFIGTPRRDGDGWLFYAGGVLFRVEDADPEVVFVFEEDYEPDAGDDVVDLFVEGPGHYLAMQQGVGSDAVTGMTYGVLHWIDNRAATLQVAAVGGPRHAGEVVELDRILTPSGDTSSLILTDDTGAQTRIKTGHSPSVVRSSPTDSGRFSVVDRLGGSVRIYNPDDTWLTYETDGWPVDLVWADDGSAVYVYENGRDALVRMDASTGVATTLWDDEGVNTALLFGSIALADDVIYVAAGGQELVRAFDLDGTLRWETALADPVGREGPDRFDSLSIGVDATGRIWTLDSLKGSIAVLDADGTLLGQERLPGDVSNDALFVGDDVVYAGPWPVDVDTLQVGTKRAFDGERVLAIRDGVRLVDDDGGFGWEGGPRYQHTRHIYGGGYRAIWDPPTQGVWLSRFGVGELELVVED